MKTVQLRPHQIQAISAIRSALQRKQKNILVEMANGCGKSLVLAKTVEELCKTGSQKILILVDRLENKQLIKNALFKNDRDIFDFDPHTLSIETVQYVLKQSTVKYNEFQFVIFFDTLISAKVYDLLLCKDKNVIVFSSNSFDKIQPFFTSEEIVFSYSFEDAVQDGNLTPAMNPKALEATIDIFSKQLLEQFGYYPITAYPNTPNKEWDLVVCKDQQKIWVEYKAYKNQTVSPATANSLLKNIVMRKMVQDIPESDMVLLIIFSRIPSFQKDIIFKRYKIIVWDIENLVFYSNISVKLLKQLSQITYFPIDYIEGIPSEETSKAGLSFVTSEEKIIYEEEKEAIQNENLIQQLKACRPGPKNSGDYEDICEKIIRALFEANYFNRLTKQHKTEDEHFRMDLIGSLKTNQNNEKSIHPLWQMLVQHYNSHFVVFEFKNYSKEIDQNLIFITEKYLFNAALRNVAFIISRKGFSQSAKFAAEGCLKEHGKLILDISEEDLIKMLQVESDEAADYLLGKLEDFLMGISK